MNYKLVIKWGSGCGDTQWHRNWTNTIETYARFIPVFPIGLMK